MNISWDNKRWISEFEKASEAIDIDSIRSLRILVFRNSQEVVANGGYDNVKISDPPKSFVFSKPITGLKPQNNTGVARIIKVLNEDCLETAKKLEKENPLVLNMASRRRPGGGVENGAGAQEEHLFRSSNYYRTLYGEY